jgi:excisionase family DNA binding protein
MADLLTVAEAATILRKKPVFVYSELKRGNLRGSYYGGQWHIERGAIDEYVAAHTNVRPVEKRTRKGARRSA